MKTKTTQSEPPAVAGGLAQEPTNPSNIEETNDQPPATAGGTDLTDLQTENANLKAAIRLKDARAAVTEELGKSGARSPELLWDALAGEIEFDDTDAGANIDSLIAKAREKYPEQFTPTSVTGSIDGGAGQTATARLTREALKRMTPSEIAELDWEEVKRVLAAR
ncbi:MAG: hypothetical protein WBO10_06255 [Pyrinomonadaceae bacterium]